jgi:hypothetical protein
VSRRFFAFCHAGNLVEMKSGEVVYSYAVHKGNSYRGKQSAAEACAKHMKEKLENPGKK